jgi:hypothetical protein
VFVPVAPGGDDKRDPESVAGEREREGLTAGPRMSAGWREGSVLIRDERGDGPWAASLAGPVCFPAACF